VATNRKLKAALLTKLGITEQALNLRAQRRKKRELPMTTEQAYYTIAFEEGIDVSRFLSHEQTAEVRGLVAQLRAAKRSAASTNGASGTKGRAAKAPTKNTLVTIAGVNVQQLPGLTAAHAREAKLMAEKVYPTLYVFENSVRDVISRVLNAAYGNDWWTKAVPVKVQKKASSRRTAEQKEPWHGRRGASDIHYVDLPDLWAIIHHRWAHFAPLFPSPAWVESLITSDMNVSRGRR
jgi:Swt1-like HEPN